jgi:hypothetical protein
VSILSLLSLWIPEVLPAETGLNLIVVTAEMRV